MRRAALVLSITALLGIGATPVLAAAPSNDAYAGRTVIPAVPFSETIDTTEATSDADDAELMNQCGAPAMDASVWYEYTAASGRDLILTAYDSDYPVGLLVASGSPGAFAVVACGPGGVQFTPALGETYTIQLFDYQGDGGGNGGTLSWLLREAPAAPEIELTLDPIGSFNAATGVATIRGTVRCSEGIEKAGIDLLISQSIGRFRLNGQGGGTFTCDGQTNAWTAEASSADGKFGGGKATVSVFAFVCNEGGCADAQAAGTVTLRR